MTGIGGWLRTLVCAIRGHRWERQGHGGPPWWRVCRRCHRWEEQRRG
jgi:hypothetical protein